MSIVSLIRHGQASFAADEYDELSPLGIVQARRVGQWLAGARPRISALYSGPRRRQLDTARYMRESAGALGVALPEIVMREELDELPVRPILAASLPELIGDDPRLLSLARSGNFKEARAGISGEVLLAAVQRAIRKWAEGKLVIDGVESPESFVARVERVLAEVAAAGDEVAVVTSGGPIAVCLVRTGELRLEQAFERAMRLANASITELDIAAAAAVTVLPGNPVAHLPPDEVTHI